MIETRSVGTGRCGDTYCRPIHTLQHTTVMFAGRDRYTLCVYTPESHDICESGCESIALSHSPREETWAATGGLLRGREAQVTH